MRCFFGTSSALFNFLVEGLELRKLHQDREFLGMRDSDDHLEAKVRFLTAKAKVYHFPLFLGM